MADDDLLQEEPPRPVAEGPVAAAEEGGGVVAKGPAKGAATNAPAEKAPVKKASTAKKAPAGKTAAKKTPAKKTAAKKTAAKKTAAKKAPTDKTAAKKAAAKKTAAKKAAAKKTAAKRAPAKKVAAAAPGAALSGPVAADPTEARSPDFGTGAEAWTAAPRPAPVAWGGTEPKAEAPPPAGPRTTWAPPPPKAPKEPKAPKPPKGRKDSNAVRLSKPRRGRRILLVVIALAALAATAFFVAKALGRAGDGDDYSSLKVGDCLKTPSGTEVKGVETQPCAGPHDAEVYAVVQHPAPPQAPYPGVPALVDFAGRSCLGQAFTDYVGRPRAESSLKNLEIVPKRSAWDDGRRQMVCAVDNAGGPKLTGSVRGTSR